MKRPATPLGPGGIIGKRDLRQAVEAIYDRWGVPTVPDAVPEPPKPAEPARRDTDPDAKPPRRP